MREQTGCRVVDFLFTLAAVNILELLILLQSCWLAGTFFDKDLLISGFITPPLSENAISTLSKTAATMAISVKMISPIAIGM